MEKPSDITAADKLIFPGVGSFGQAIKVLQERDYSKPLVEYIQVSAQMFVAVLQQQRRMRCQQRVFAGCGAVASLSQLARLLALNAKEGCRIDSCAVQHESQVMVAAAA